MSRIRSAKQRKRIMYDRLTIMVMAIPPIFFLTLFTLMVLAEAGIL